MHSSGGGLQACAAHGAHRVGVADDQRLQPGRRGRVAQQRHEGRVEGRGAQGGEHVGLRAPQLLRRLQQAAVHQLRGRSGRGWAAITCNQRCGWRCSLNQRCGARCSLIQQNKRAAELAPLGCQRSTHVTRRRSPASMARPPPGRACTARWPPAAAAQTCLLGGREGRWGRDGFPRRRFTERRALRDRASPAVRKAAPAARLARHATRVPCCSLPSPEFSSIMDLRRSVARRAAGAAA